MLTFMAFVTSLVFALSSDDGSFYNYKQQEGGEGEARVAVTSRALVFAAMWTAVLATLLAIFGTVVLGWQSPTGEYYTCCSPQVHKTTPIAVGSFIGSLIMFANLTLLCSVLFGEFEVRLLTCNDNFCKAASNSHAPTAGSRFPGRRRQAKRTRRPPLSS
jgi:hypothetical protein